MEGEFSVEELEALFKDDVTEVTPDAPPVADSDAAPAAEPAKNSVEQTKVFSQRLKEVTSKAIADERESIAKGEGYASYEEMLKRREEKLYRDKGLNPDDVSPIVEELVKKRLESDPRLKELDSYRIKQVEEYGKRELAEISKLTDGEITQLNQLPKAVLDIWKTTGSLKQAYIQVEGENLIIKAKNNSLRGNTNHLQSPTGGIPPSTNERPLTDEEKRTWKFFNPTLTDEEINKKTVKTK